MPTQTAIARPLHAPTRGAQTQAHKRPQQAMPATARVVRTSHPFERVSQNPVGELQIDVLPGLRLAVGEHENVLHAWDLPSGRRKQDVPRSILPAKIVG